MRRVVLMLAGLALVTIMPIHPLRAEMPAARTLSVPGRANTAPSVAARDQFVAVAWGATGGGPGADVFIAISRDGGRRFAPPVRVNALERDAKVGGEFPPRIVVSRGTGADPEIAVLWTASVDGRTSIRLARSTDGGRTFTPPVMLQAPDAAGNRGWASLAAGEPGDLYAIWLDHRGLAGPAPPDGMHAGHAMGGSAAEKRDGVAMAARSGLYFARVGGAPAPVASTGTAAGPGERELAKGVCYCCKTALAAGRDGSVYAAWRHVYAGNIRDIAFAASTDSGRTFSAPVRVSEDHWAIDGCPENGPALAVDPRGTVHVAWPTLVDGDEPEAAIFYATTADGRHFTPRLRIPTLGTPKPGHVQLLSLGPGRLLVAWDESRDGLRRVAVREMTLGAPGEATFGDAIVLNGEVTGANPALARTSDGAIVAWTSGAPEQSAIRMATVATGQMSEGRALLK